VSGFLLELGVYLLGWSEWSLEACIGVCGLCIGCVECTVHFMARCLNGMNDEYSKQ
jgi:hypothetical protein